MRYLLRLLTRLGPALAVILLTRWGMGIASPHQDKRTLLRGIGWLERLVTRADAIESRIKVWLVDRFGIDQLRWEGMRRRYASGGYYGDTA